MFIGIFRRNVTFHEDWSPQRQLGGLSVPGSPLHSRHYCSDSSWLAPWSMAQPCLACNDRSRRGGAELISHAGAKLGCSGTWCFRMWGLNISVQNPSLISALGVKSPHLRLSRVNQLFCSNPTSSDTTSLNSRYIIYYDIL